MEAKKAATDPSLSRPHDYRPLKSARARYVKSAAKEQWHKAWVMMEWEYQNCVGITTYHEGKIFENGPSAI